MSKKKKLTLKDMPTGDEEGEYSEEFRKSLLRSAKDIKEGKTRKFVPGAGKSCPAKGKGRWLDI